MTGETNDIAAQAAHWHVASESDAMDWDAFADWLDADPSHRRAYDEVALADAALLDNRAVLADINIEEPGNEDSETVIVPNRRRFLWAGAAMAATLAALLVWPRLAEDPARVYETQMQTRTIALDDGSSITLAPRSRLAIEGRDDSHMALTGGAIFAIRHDPARTLTVTAGDLSISDIGTRFDIQANPDNVRVAVSDGEVLVGSQRFDKPLRLTAGKGLDLDVSRGAVIVSPVRGEDVGAWHSGRLSFDAAPLGLVARDLSRYAGVDVNIPAALRDRRFSGTLVIDDGNAAIRDLAQVMGLRLSGHPGDWSLSQP